MDLNPAFLVQVIVIALILLHGVAKIRLESLNRAWLRGRGAIIPSCVADDWDEPTLRKMVDYQMAQSHLVVWDAAAEIVIRLVVLFSGFLPWLHASMTGAMGTGSWSIALFIFAAMMLVSMLDWPLDYLRSFRVEQAYGFNTMTPSLWWLDNLKGLLLAAVLGVPLLAGLMFLVEWAGPAWWACCWALTFGVQLLLVVLAPMFILPLFNKFTPLGEGTLKERLLKLAERTGFSMKQLEVMDGSRRSRHSNAFFTGYGRLRKVVLFDTLMESLDEPEIESVVAHEIGHAKLGHIPRMIAVSSLGMLVGFYVLYLLAGAPWFYEAFGFEAGHPAPVFLICFFLASSISFWLKPLFSGWSRKREFEADAYAATWSDGAALGTALRKLNEENLSQVTPQPWYRLVYYSHPTVVERLEALSEGRSRKAE